MIPQNLLLAFLSLQSQIQGRSGAPESSQLDLNVFDSVSGNAANYQLNGIGDVEPVRVGKYDQQQVVSNDERPVYRFPFEKFATGSYDEAGLKYHDDASGNVQVTTNTTSHLWSLAESFPYINPRHEHRNVQGGYPNPTGITVNFQKNWKQVRVTLGYLSPKGFAEGKFLVIYRANRKLFSEEITVGNGWTVWTGKAPEGGPHDGIDHVNIFYATTPHVTNEANRLVVESVTWS